MPGSAKEYLAVPVCQSAKDSWYLSRCTELCLGVSWSVRKCKKVPGIAEDCKIVWSVWECQGAPRSTEQCRQSAKNSWYLSRCTEKCLGVSWSVRK